MELLITVKQKPKSKINDKLKVENYSLRLVNKLSQYSKYY